MLLLPALSCKLLQGHEGCRLFRRSSHRKWTGGTPSLSRYFVKGAGVRNGMHWDQVLQHFGIRAYWPPLAEPNLPASALQTGAGWGPRMAVNTPGIATCEFWMEVRLDAGTATFVCHSLSRGKYRMPQGL